MEENQLTNGTAPETEPVTAESAEAIPTEVSGEAQAAEGAPALPINEEQLKRAAADAHGDVEALARAIVKAMGDAQPAAAEEDPAEAAKARKAQARRHRARDFRAFILRTLALLLVVYVLFFHIVGITTMPSEDMYPRIDAGDLVLYYRLDRNMKAQDIVVYRKDVSEVQVREPEPTLMPGPEGSPAGEAALPEEAAGGAEAADAALPEETAAPVDTPRPVLPQLKPVPADLVADDSFLGEINRLWYNFQVSLNLRNPVGEQLFIGRVVASGGDTVEISPSGGLLVNGNHMIESNIFYNTMAFEEFAEYPITLAEDECFVLADRRDIGADSRFFGPIRRDQILGTAITVVRRNNL